MGEEKVKDVEQEKVKTRMRAKKRRMKKKGEEIEDNE